MTRLRSSINFENAFVTVVAFMALAGGVAYGAGHLGPGSVGKKQLKANSVTAKKIKVNAVTAVKIKNGAVVGAKVADGTIGAGQLSPAVPFTGIVHTMTSGPISHEADGLSAAVPLAAPTYVQQPGETNIAIGSVRITYTEGCLAGPRISTVILAYDEPKPIGLEANPKIVAAGGEYLVPGNGPEAVTIGLSSFEEGVVPAPSVATNRTLYLSSFSYCEKPGSANISAGNFNLIGIR